MRQPIAVTHPHLAELFVDPNLAATLSAGSKAKVNLRCPHGSGITWSEQVSQLTRVGRCKCERQGGKPIAVTHPQLAELFVDPDQATILSAGSRVEVDLRCIHGSGATWSESVRTLTQAGRCKCERQGGKPIAVTHPHLAALFADPSQAAILSAGSKAKVNLRCEHDSGVTWGEQVSQLTRVGKCKCERPGGKPIAVTHPHLAALFADPSQAAILSAGSGITVDLRCEHGATWSEQVCKLTQAGQCKCERQGGAPIAATHPHLAELFADPGQAATLSAGSRVEIDLRCEHGSGATWSEQVCKLTKTGKCKCERPGGKPIAVTHPHLAELFVDPNLAATLSARSGITVDLRCEHGSGATWSERVSQLTRVGKCKCERPGGKPIAVTHPHLASLFVDPDQAAILSAGSNITVDLRCEHGITWGERVYNLTEAGRCRCERLGRAQPLMDLVRSIPAEAFHAMSEASRYRVVMAALAEVGGKRNARLGKRLASGGVRWSPQSVITAIEDVAEPDGTTDPVDDASDPEPIGTVEAAPTVSPKQPPKLPAPPLEPGTDAPADIAVEVETPDPAETVAAVETTLDTLGARADDDTIRLLLADANRGLWRWICALDERRRAGEPVDFNAELSVERAKIDGATGTWTARVVATFFAELDVATSLQVPPWWGTHVPNLMQRQVAAELVANRVAMNTSGPGAGKTLSACLAVATGWPGGATVAVVAPVSTLDGWTAEITAAFAGRASIAEATTASWLPKGRGDVRPFRFVLIGWPQLSQPSAVGHAADLAAAGIDVLVIDEAHLGKATIGSEQPSRRRTNLGLLRSAAAEHNHALAVLSMTATPTLNHVGEATSVIETLLGKDPGLPSSDTIDSAIEVHAALVGLGPRYRVDYTRFAHLTVNEVRVDATEAISEATDARQDDSPPTWAEIDRMLTVARAPQIAEVAAAEVNRRRAAGEPDGIVVYTHYVARNGEQSGGKLDGEILDTLRHHLVERGLSVAVYDGSLGRRERAERLAAFAAGDVNVLVATSAIATGTDGLQLAASSLLVNSLPWTHAAWEQLLGRLVRQGQQAPVKVIRFAATGVNDAGEPYQLDDWRWQVIASKRTISDTVADGRVPPGGKIITPEAAEAAHNVWVQRLERRQRLATA